MEHPSLSSLQSLVSEVKNQIFSDHIEFNIHKFVSPSAYDTAWLALIADQTNQNAPMFKNCLNWVLENQKEGGFWGETNEDDMPTIDNLPATLVCMVALNKWNQGPENIEKGLAFIQSKAAEEIIVKLCCQNLPHWFVLVFPAMIELAEAQGLNLHFPSGLREGIMADIFLKRQQLQLIHEQQKKSFLQLPYLETLSVSSNSNYYELLSDEKEIVKHVNSNGSLFDSPSATARAFMATNNLHFINYLQSLVQKFPDGGVPGEYPIDEDLIKLCLVDHIQRLGLAEHFNQYIHQILSQLYRNQKVYYKSIPKEISINMMRLPRKLFKDSLAFRLLRMQGHNVNPGMFCWFLNDSEMQSYMEENSEQFITAMYSVYRATDLSFPGELELEEAKDFALNMLHNHTTNTATCHNYDLIISKGLQNVIKHELNVPWSARLDHLNHRLWIEENYKTTTLFCWNIGKPASYVRLLCFDNKKLIQLAVQNYEFRQLIYRQELEEMKRWSKNWGLSDMGFGREKTIYAYFAIAASSCLPFNSMQRLIITKAIVIVTVADDFYDMEGSLTELKLLTEAIQRWDGKGLEGHGKAIFDALDDFVNEIATNFSLHQRSKVVTSLRNIWGETFTSWMVEKTWSETQYAASMDEYLENGMISIAVHAIALPATTYFFDQTSSSREISLNNVEYHNITKFLMAIARLLNDTQSYQKEEADGKMNFVHLHKKENPHTDGASIEDSITYVKQIIETKRKQFLKHVFMDDSMPKSCKQLHLSCMKAFYMFFNTANLFDSETALFDDIEKAIYLPIRSELKFKFNSDKSKSDPILKPLPSIDGKNTISKISA